MKKGCFELGGSDPFIVLDDSDIDLAVEKAYISRMVNNGQACINAKRFIIMDSVYDKFRDALIDKISTTKIGDAMDSAVNLGPLAIKHLTEKLVDQVNDSVNQGCKKTYEGPEPISGDPRGNFFKPVVLENIPTNSRAYCEELFGPVFSLYRVKSEQEAIRVANDSEYGLGAAVFSSDIERAEQVAR